MTNLPPEPTRLPSAFQVEFDPWLLHPVQAIKICGVNDNLLGETYSVLLECPCCREIIRLSLRHLKIQKGRTT
jgi:hypothetical protein